MTHRFLSAAMMLLAVGCGAMDSGPSAREICLAYGVPESNYNSLAADIQQEVESGNYSYDVARDSALVGCDRGCTNNLDDPANYALCIDRCTDCTYAIIDEAFDR